jgi:hypothetical protein
MVPLTQLLELRFLLLLQLGERELFYLELMLDLCEELGADRDQLRVLIIPGLIPCPLDRRVTVDRRENGDEVQPRG